MLVLPHLLRRFVRKGRLALRTHDGSEHRFGSGVDGPSVSIRLMDAKVERELFFNPELATGEAYMDGRLVFEDGSSIYDLLLLFSVNRQGLASHPLQIGQELVDVRGVLVAAAPRAEAQVVLDAHVTEHLTPFGDLGDGSARAHVPGCGANEPGNRVHDRRLAGAPCRRRGGR